MEVGDWGPDVGRCYSRSITRVRTDTNCLRMCTTQGCVGDR